VRYELESLNFLGVSTINCIVTGEPATCWTGYVVGKTFARLNGLGQAVYTTIIVTAGFANRALMDEACKKSRTVEGFGNWKPSDGLMDSHGSHLAKLRDRITALEAERDKFKAEADGLLNKFIDQYREPAESSEQAERVVPFFGMKE
jgi:hypothetical protein